MDQSQILIVGANGQLGTALREQYPKARAVDSSVLDIADSVAVSNFDWSGISVILNAAAYTDVDGAETIEGRVTAWAVNALGTANLATVAREHDCTLVHISTEYVFDGSQAIHNEDEPLSPLSAYGSSKASGEIAAQSTPRHYLIRTSWVIGKGKNFVRTMIGLGQKGIAPTVVGDQTGRLTFTDELVRAIDHLVSNSAPYGIYNVSNSGDEVSWAEVTRAVFAAGAFNLQVSETTTEAYFADKPAAAARPLNSAFDLTKLEATGIVMHDWREDLQEYVKKELAQ